MVDQRENRIHMYLSNEEKDAIDDWRFAHRVATRSDAIRRLCRLGLILDEKIEPMLSKHGAASEGLLTMMEALDVFGPDGKIRDDFPANPQQKALAHMVEQVAYLESSLKLLVDQARAVSKEGELSEVFQSLDWYKGISQKILGETQKE